MFAIAAALTALPGWLARTAHRPPTQIVIASSGSGASVQPQGALSPAGARYCQTCLLEAFSPEHVMATFSQEDGDIALFADWSSVEWQAVRRYLPDDAATATVVLTDEPELAVGALSAANRSCKVFPASMADLQPLVRIFTNFRGLAAANGLTA